MMGKLTIQEIARVLVEKNGLTPKEANRFATEMFSVVLQHLQEDDPVKIKGLGTFKIINVEARESVSVRTGERVVIDSHSKVTFTPDTVMKELVNKPFSQFETVVLNDGVEFEDIKEDVAEEDAASEEPVAEPVIIEREVIAPVEEPAPVEEEPALVAEETDPVVEEPVAEEPAPVVEEPVAEEKPAALVAEEPVAPEKAPEETTMLEFEDEKPRWSRRVLQVCGVLALMLLAGYFGYVIGRQQQDATAEVVVKTDTVYVAEIDAVNPAEQEAEVAVAETVVEQPSVKEEPKPVAQEQPKPVVKEEPKSVVKEQPKPAEETLDKWSQKDDRVRLGAYRIVGTAQEVTIQQGQTFAGICRAYLGTGMECYVEVYNNLPRNPQVKPGQVIKIPKLQVKKRKK